MKVLGFFAPVATLVRCRSLMARQGRPMRRALFLGVALTSLFAAGSSLAASELCEHVKSFEQKPLSKLPDGELQRRWMDFSWGPPENPQEGEIQIGATLKCDGSDDVAKALCQYAVHHSPHENISALPLDILHCYGFVSKWAAFTHRWVQELSWDAPSDLIERFEIDQLDRPDHVPAMRLTIMPYPESPQAKKPAPFFKALSTKLGLDEDEE